MDLYSDGPLAMFNKIYASHNDEKGFNLDDKPEFGSVLSTLKEYGMPTDNFLENLKTLSIKKVENLNVLASYLPKQNKIEYCDWKMLKHELFHMASSNGKDTTGVSFRTKSGSVTGNALKEGITEFFSKLNDSNYQCEYPFEKMCAEVLAYCYGIEIFKPHFEADPLGFVAQFDDRIAIMDFMDKLDKYQKHYEKACMHIIEGGKEYSKIPAETSMVNFFFNGCLAALAKLFYQSKENDKEAFEKFIANGLNDESMEQVMLIVTKFGTMEIGGGNYHM